MRYISEPKVGMRGPLESMRRGWRVLYQGEEVTVWSSFENQTRVYRDGDDGLQLLPNDTEVEITDIPDKTATHWYANVLAPGTVVKVLAPSKSAGRIGIVVKGLDRFTLISPGSKVFYVDRDFLLPVKGELRIELDTP